MPHLARRRSQKKKRVGRTRKIRRSATRKIQRTPIKKHHVTDAEIGAMCKTGQYSTYEGNFYNKETLGKFQDLANTFKKLKNYKKWKTPQEKYSQFLKKEFDPQHDTAQNIEKMRNNFYGYANDVWFKEHDIEKGEKKYYVQHDEFRFTQEKVYYTLMGYVHDFIKANPRDKTAQALSAVYRSLTTNTQAKFKKRVAIAVDDVDQALAKNDMYAWLAYLNCNETIKWSVPVQWISTVDEKNVKVYMSHLMSAQLGIYDYLIYLEDNKDDAATQTYKKKVKRNYLAYIDEVFKACLGPAAAKNYKATDIWEVEIQILMAMNCAPDLKDDPDGYNKVNNQELERLCDFDWPTFAKHLGFAPARVPKNVIVGSLNALKCTTAMLKENWNTPAWRTYWIFIQLKQMIRFEVTHREIHYRFYNKFLEGQPVIMPKEIYAIFGLSMLFNAFLSELYAKFNYNALYVEYIKHLTGDMKALFIKKIERNTWLSPKTKVTALRKLQKLEIFVGLPVDLRREPLFSYEADDPVGNIGKLLLWKHKKTIELEGKGVIDAPEIDWQIFKLTGTQCYIVNAFYRSISNSIYIPLAYIQKPFVDLDNRGLEYNLVYIGYTLGHELSHCLDNTGSRFDENGNLNNWWTPEDRKKFQAKVDDVTKQYELFAKRDGIKFNASIGVGENLADISGYALIEEYLMDHQVINDEDVKLKKINLAKLYLNLAVQGRQLVYKGAVKAQLKMNPHPMEKYRINCPLARMELFRTIFGVRKGDQMWWHNTDTIW